MERHGVQRLVFSSTAGVYGEPQESPTPETHPASPINPYGRSKVIFERVLEDYRIHSGLQHVALRYFNAAGASEWRGEDHSPETHIVPLLLDVALGQRGHFQVYGTDYDTPDGTCVRDYVHVLDLIDAHLLALECLERLAGQVFNVGSDRGYSVLELIEAARRITGKQIQALIGPRRKGDATRLVASSAKIRRELGWTPQYSTLESILESAWAWKQRYPNGYRKRG